MGSHHHWNQVGSHHLQVGSHYLLPCQNREETASLQASITVILSLLFSFPFYTEQLMCVVEVRGRYTLSHQHSIYFRVQ